MKAEKRCDNCFYGKINTKNIMLPVLCLRSIREVKSQKCIRYAVHSVDDKCRNWKSSECEGEENDKLPI